MNRNSIFCITLYSKFIAAGSYRTEGCTALISHAFTQRVHGYHVLLSSVQQCIASTVYVCAPPTVGSEMQRTERQNGVCDENRSRPLALPRPFQVECVNFCVPLYDMDICHYYSYSFSGMMQLHSAFTDELRAYVLLRRNTTIPYIHIVQIPQVMLCIQSIATHKVYKYV